MSFPKYIREDQFTGQDYDDFENVSFSDLAKYANNNQDGDISLAQCVDDLNGFGEVGPSNVGLIYQTGRDKADNISGSTNNRKGRVEFTYSVNIGNGLFTSNSWFLKPTVDPFGVAMTSSFPQAYAPDTLKITDTRICLVAEEDDVEYPSTSLNTKVDRYMLGSSATDGALPSNLPYTHNLLTIQNDFSILNTDIDQTNVYGVPERVFLDQFTVEHEVSSTGATTHYYLWLTWGYRVSTSGNSEGFNTTLDIIAGEWQGPFLRNAGSAFTTISTGLGSLDGLETAFAPIDDTIGSYLSGSNNNFADFKIQILHDAAVWVNAASKD